MLLAIGVFRTRLTAYTHREVGFSAENDVFGRRIVPKPRRRLLAIAHFHRKSVSARLRRLLAISGFWARLIAHTHREVVFWAENVVFGRQIVPNPRRRLLVIAHLQRKLVSARVCILIANCIFRVWLTAYTHRKRDFLPKSALKAGLLPRAYTLR